MEALLSSASILLAVASLFYGAWSEDIRRALERSPKKQPSDRKPDYDHVKALLLSRALPLLLLAGSMAVILGPSTCDVLASAISCVRVACQYDPLQATLFLVEACLTMLTVHLGNLTFSLFRRLQQHRYQGAA